MIPNKSKTWQAAMMPARLSRITLQTIGGIFHGINSRLFHVCHLIRDKRANIAPVAMRLAGSFFGLK